MRGRFTAYGGFTLQTSLGLNFVLMCMYKCFAIRETSETTFKIADPVIQDCIRSIPTYIHGSEKGSRRSSEAHGPAPVFPVVFNEEASGATEPDVRSFVASFYSFRAPALRNTCVGRGRG